MRYFIFGLMLVALIAMPAMAVPPPAQGGYNAGWGMNPTTWEEQSGSFEASGLWVPGHDWAVDYDEEGDPIYIEYENITLELWVELSGTQTYEYTSYQWHRLGNEAEWIEFLINGTAMVNNPVRVSLTRVNEDLDHLYFRHDIFGQDHGEPDIEIEWSVRWGRGLVTGQDVRMDWTEVEPNNQGALAFYINEPCDHWFQYKGRFYLPYHIADGYYSLTMGGCPTPEL